jgi:AraC-like DNA-binding protein/quercetin dioxygenase-like cupin family protein
MEVIMEKLRDYFIVKTVLPESENSDIYYTDAMPSTMEEYSILTVRAASFDSNGDFFYGYYDERSSRLYQITRSSHFDPEHYGKLHNHNYFEMVFVLDGEMDVQIESGKYHYRKGDGYLLNRNIRHTEMLTGSWKTLYLCFWKECLLEWPKKLADLAVCNKSIYNFFSRNFEDEIKNNKDYIDFHIQHNAEEYFPAKEILDSLYNEITKKDAGFQLVTYGLIARLLTLLNNSGEYSTYYIDLGSASEQNVAENAKRYIDEHKRRITRDELGEALHYNGDYINRIFRKYTGESMHHYCQKVYMKEAARLLLETDFSAIDISRNLGFENRTQFYKIFNDYYQTTPHEFRLSNGIHQ